MNLAKSALLDDVAEASLTADVDGLLTLGAAPVSVVMETPTTTTTANWTTGALSRTAQSDSLTAFLAPLTAKEVEAIPLALASDSWLLMPKVSVTVAPTPDSWATIGTDRWKVESVDTPPLSTHYRMRVRVHA